MKSAYRSYEIILIKLFSIYMKNNKNISDTKLSKKNAVFVTTVRK